MTQSEDRRKDAVSVRRISHKTRIALSAIGVASWAAGGSASFLSANGAGAAALVAIGGICSTLGLMGWWPSRISMGGSDFFWEDVQKTVNSQIQAAEQNGEGVTVLAELKDLRERLNVLQRTGTVPEHPAQAYDRAVRAAIDRLLPGAKVIRQERRSREVADFVVRYRGSELFVETKWRSDPAQQFGGSTLQALVSRLPPEGRLLVVVNAPPMPRANAVLRDTLGERGKIVQWQAVSDDSALGEALTSLLGTVTTPALRQSCPSDECSPTSLGIRDVACTATPSQSYGLQRMVRPAVRSTEFRISRWCCNQPLPSDRETR